MTYDDGTMDVLVDGKLERRTCEIVMISGDMSHKDSHMSFREIRAQPDRKDKEIIFYPMLGCSHPPIILTIK